MAGAHASTLIHAVVASILGVRFGWLGERKGVGLEERKGGGFEERKGGGMEERKGGGLEEPLPPLQPTVFFVDCWL